MRIVCPRCVAQYEVDESAIPETGREVQCANCENIWFQDYIEMLPTADDSDAQTEEDRGVFDDLDGKSEASFYSERGAGPDTDADNKEDIFDDVDTELGDLDQDFEDDFDEEDDEDDTPATNIPVPPVDEDVLDVLRSEAAFSSARDQIDAAAADALDGDGESLKAALDDTIDGNSDPDLDDLSAFLDAHKEDEVEAEYEKEPEPLEVDDAPEAEPSFDPLADLDAIRSQLNDIGAEQSETTEYAPNLPPDDPIDVVAHDVLEETEHVGQDVEEAAIDDTIDDLESGIEAEPEYDAPEFDAAALSAALDAGGTDSGVTVDADDDLDDGAGGPRHAYRADAVSKDVEESINDIADDIEDTVEEDLNEAEADLAAALNGMSNDAAEKLEGDLDSEDDSSGAGLTTAAAAVTGAAAAVGMTRPRSSGGRARARAMPGFGETPKPVETPDTLLDEASDAVDDIAQDVALPDIEVEDNAAVAVDTDRKADPSRRPKADRKAMLPDVEELDASLRSEAAEPRRRDREMMEAHEGELAKSNRGGFRRAFIWTLFIIALLIALYILRPQLVAALPPSAIVLDPYAAAIDSVRALINGLLG